MIRLEYRKNNIQNPIITILFLIKKKLVVKIKENIDINIIPEISNEGITFKNISIFSEKIS